MYCAGIGYRYVWYQHMPPGLYISQSSMYVCFVSVCVISICLQDLTPHSLLYVCLYVYVCLNHICLQDCTSHSLLCVCVFVVCMLAAYAYMTVHTIVCYIYVWVCVSSTYAYMTAYLILCVCVKLSTYAYRAVHLTVCYVCMFVCQQHIPSGLYISQSAMMLLALSLRILYPKSSMSSMYLSNSCINNSSCVSTKFCI